jgi:hypothetical protein
MYLMCMMAMGVIILTHVMLQLPADFQAALVRHGVGILGSVLLVQLVFGAVRVVVSASRVAREGWQRTRRHTRRLPPPV